MEPLTRAEFDERVAIMRRFKAALERQRDRFRRYLDELERHGQANAGTEPGQALEFHVEMERAIVHEIASFERTIEPLETLYRAHDPDGAREIPALREALDLTRDEVVRRTEISRAALLQHIEALRDEISSLRIMQTDGASDRPGRHAAGRSHSPEPGLVDVTA